MIQNGHALALSGFTNLPTKASGRSGARYEPHRSQSKRPPCVIASADHSLIQEKQSTIFRKKVVDVPGSNPGGSLYVDE